MQAESTACSYAEGRFQKELRLRRSAVLSADETAQAISDYVQLVDGALQAFLSLWPDHAAACQAAARQRALYEQGACQAAARQRALYEQGDPLLL